MDEAYLGMIAQFAFNFPPSGWALCQGQTLPLSQNTALFALLGTQYGGNGQTTFALPDLRGRSPIGFHNGPGLTPYFIGQMEGVENIILTSQNLPAHTHAINGTTEAGTTASPEGAYPANTGGLDKEYKATTTAKVLMNTAMVTPNGNNHPVSIMQPFLTINYSIALQGIFPPRK